MNRWVAFVLGCVIGGAVASALWKWHLTRSQIDLVVMHVSDRAWQADLGQQILSYMDNPDTAKATRLEMVASNLVVTFPEDIALFDQEYRFMNLMPRLRPSLEEAQEFMEHRHAKSVQEIDAPTDE